MARYRFVNWTDELGAVVSTNPTYNPMITSDKTFTANYVPVTEVGVLTVDTTPVAGEIYVNGALVGAGHFSGVLSPGSYTVSFGAVVGWRTPAIRTVSVIANMETTVLATYVSEEEPPDLTLLLPLAEATVGIAITSAALMAL